MVHSVHGCRSSACRHNRADKRVPVFSGRQTKRLLDCRRYQQQPTHKAAVESRNRAAWPRWPWSRRFTRWMNAPAKQGTKLTIQFVRTLLVMSESFRCICKPKALVHLEKPAKSRQRLRLQKFVTTLAFLSQRIHFEADDTAAGFNDTVNIQKDYIYRVIRVLERPRKRASAMGSVREQARELSSAGQNTEQRARGLAPQIRWRSGRQSIEMPKCHTMKASGLRKLVRGQHRVPPGAGDMSARRESKTGRWPAVPYVAAQMKPWCPRCTGEYQKLR